MESVDDIVILRSSIQHSFDDRTLIRVIMCVRMYVLYSALQLSFTPIFFEGENVRLNNVA